MANVTTPLSRDPTSQTRRYTVQRFISQGYFQVLNRERVSCSMQRRFAGFLESKPVTVGQQRIHGFLSIDKICALLDGL